MAWEPWYRAEPVNHDLATNRPAPASNGKAVQPDARRDDRPDPSSEDREKDDET
jgi:hypothetical protein